MLDKIKRSIQFQISPPVALKRTTTTTDSSTVSLSDDVNLDRHGKPRRLTGEGENKLKHNQRRKIQIDHDESYNNNRDCSKTTSSSNGSRTKRPSRVSFAGVTIREYNRSLGDWWDITNGLGLGWEYIEHPATPLLLDDDDKTKGKVAKLQRDQVVKKIRVMIRAWFMASRNKRHSMGGTGTSTGTSPEDSVLNSDDASDESGRNNKNSSTTTVITDKKNTQSKKKKSQTSKQKSDRKKRSSSCIENKHSTTASFRKELLIKFGFVSEELDLSERERKILRMEYSHWTQASDLDRSKLKPSALFLERFLADVRDLHVIPNDGTVR
mmetsp:Transcript_25195/g.55240  ORF Transcript_25195/g.55240 Transcript_25195/m.55240 type:complete len:325 (-) Transcript_25195:263-1237(-)